MDEDRIKGKGKQIAGKVKEAAGSVFDDSSTELEGKVDQVKGSIQRMLDEGVARRPLLSALGALRKVVP